MAGRSLGQLTLDLLVKLGGFKAGMDQAERIVDKRTKAINAHLRGLRNGFAGVATAMAGAFAAAGVFNQFQAVIDKLDQLQDASKRFNIPVEDFAALGYAAQQSGTSMETLASTIPKLQKAMAETLDSGSEQAKMFEDIGVKVQNSDGSFRDFKDVLYDVADVMAGMTDETLRNSVAVTAFGKSGGEMIEFLSQGSSAIKEMEDKAKRLGDQFNGDNAQAAAQFKDDMASLKLSVDNATVAVAAGLLPELTKLVQDLTEVSANSQKAQAATDFLSGAFDAARAAVGLLVAGYGVLRGAIDTVITGISMAITYIKTANQLMQDFFTVGAGYTDRIKNTISQAGQQIQADGEAWAQSMGDNGLLVVDSLEDVKHAISGTISEVDRMKQKTESAAAKEKEATAAANKEHERKLNIVKGLTAQFNLAGREQNKLNAEAIAASQKILSDDEKEIALMGVKSEHAKRLYEIEKGEYRDKDEAFKKQYLANGLLIDQKQELSEASKGGGGSSEIDREAEAYDRLQESITDTKNSMQERFDLIGVTSDTAILKYKLEHGMLEGITQEQKDQLLNLSQMTEEKEAQLEAEEKAAAAAEDAARAAEAEAMRKQEQFDSVMQDYADEIEMLQLTQDEQEILNAMRWAGVDATSAQGEALRAAVLETQALHKSISDQVEVADTLRDSFGTAFKDFVSGAKSFKDAMTDALDSILSKILDMIAQNLMDQLFGQQGDLLGGLFGGSAAPGGAASGGSGIAGFFSSLFGRAGGGTVGAGQMYRVAENGPEMLTVSGKDYLMMGRNSGTVTPSNGLGGKGGGVSQVINFQVSGRMDRRTENQIALAVGQRTQVAARRA